MRKAGRNSSMKWDRPPSCGYRSDRWNDEHKSSDQGSCQIAPGHLKSFLFNSVTKVAPIGTTLSVCFSNRGDIRYVTRLGRNDHPSNSGCLHALLRIDIATNPACSVNHGRLFT
ncbi:hypothetical protein EVAR_74895_1 [Eumeta japonica]|uniref:Uncharacterized protein n=1 Tax=Eumeta variegata TaxID=151549 RepID=A0A4C1Z3A3_EUMVA|nr:hypothetical protein EVAR_74895_1 [Eumeta japonica]